MLQSRERQFCIYRQYSSIHNLNSVYQTSCINLLSILHTALILKHPVVACLCMNVYLACTQRHIVCFVSFLRTHWRYKFERNFIFMNDDVIIIERRAEEPCVVFFFLNLTKSTTILLILHKYIVLRS